MTAQSAKSQDDARRAKESQDAVARSLERELSLLTEERRERARQLGFDVQIINDKSAN